MSLFAARLGFLDLLVLRFEALGSPLALKHLFHEGSFPILVGQSSAEEFRRSFDYCANLGELGYLRLRSIFLVMPLRVED